MDYDFYILDKQTPEPVRRDLFVLIKDFLSNMSCDYPDFDLWLVKIQSQLETDMRSIIVCKSISDDKILGVSILKKTLTENKICTLRVANKYQRMYIGSKLMELSIRILEDEKPLITVSEDHIAEFSSLLKSFGFEYKNKVKSLYVKDKYEYFYNKPYEPHSVLMSIKPQYAMAIASGEKMIEFRKRPLAKSVNRIYVYASAPLKRIIGYFDVSDVVCDTPTALWNCFSSIGCIEKKNYFDYYSNNEYAYGIKIKQYHALNKCKNPVMFSGSFTPPQSFMYINNKKFLNWLNK